MSLFFLQRFLATLNKTEVKSFIFLPWTDRSRGKCHTFHWHSSLTRPGLGITWAPPKPRVTLYAVLREHISLRLQHSPRKKADVLFGRETTDRRKRVWLKAGVRGEKRDEPNKGLERWRHTVLYQASRVRCVNGMGAIGPHHKTVNSKTDFFFFLSHCKVKKKLQVVALI